MYLIESFWKCPFKGGSFNVYGTIKALQYSVSGLKILEDGYAMTVLSKSKPLQ